jgi:Uma2 family endonuclease
MNELAPQRMTVEEYLEWAVGRPGRYELVNGRPIKMSPETTGHVSTKMLVAIALMDAIEDAKLDLVALGDGATVRISEHAAFEPDALVYPGPELPKNEMVVPNPLIVVEVLSPSSTNRDTTAKLTGYFSVPSVQHYLVVDADERRVVHYKRTSGPELSARSLADHETIDLSPPGLKLAVRRCFERK